MTFGEFLQAARRDHDISLRDLGKRAGIDHMALLRIESGQTPPPSATRIRALYRALGVDGRSADVLQFLATQDADERLIHLFLQDREIPYWDFELAARMRFPWVPAEQPIPKDVWRRILTGIRAVREEAERALLSEQARKERQA
jgi:transcriptional regulator with XRE-family HTH domain